MQHLRIHLRPRRRRPGRRHSPRNRFRRPPARLDMPSLRRRQGTLREVQITPHRTTMSVFESPNQASSQKKTPILLRGCLISGKYGQFRTNPPILAEKQAISFARILTPPGTMSVIRPISSTPEDTTQRKLLKTLRRGTEPRSRALPRTPRKENIPKLCVAAHNHAAEHSREHDAKKTAQNSALRHRTTQQSTPKDTTQRKCKEAVETPLPLYFSSYLETLEC